MNLKDFLFVIVVVLSTCYVFFQSAGVVSISIILFIIFILLCLLSSMQKKPIASSNGLLLVFVLIMMTLSLLYTVDRTLTLNYLLVMLVGLLLYNIVNQHENSNYYVGKVIVVFSAFNVIITFFSFLFPSQFDSVVHVILTNLNTRFEFASGVLGQTGSNAYVICYSILYFWIQIISNTGKRPINIILFCISIVALILTGKRGPLIWIMSSCFLVDMLSSHLKHSNRILHMLSKYLVATLLLIGFSSILSNNEIISNSLARFEDMHDFSRLDLYSIAIKRIVDYFPFGLGAGAYNHFGMGAHNDYLQLLAENSIIAFCMYFAFIIRNLIISIENYKHTNEKQYLFFAGLQLFMILNATTGTSFLHYGFNLIYMEVSAAGCTLFDSKASKMD